MGAGTRDTTRKPASTPREETQRQPPLGIADDGLVCLTPIASLEVVRCCSRACRHQQDFVAPLSGRPKARIPPVPSPSAFQPPWTGSARPPPEPTGQWRAPVPAALHCSGLRTPGACSSSWQLARTLDTSPVQLAKNAAPLINKPTPAKSHVSGGRLAFVKRWGDVLQQRFFLNKGAVCSLRGRGGKPARMLPAGEKWENGNTGQCTCGRQQHKHGRDEQHVRRCGFPPGRRSSAPCTLRTGVASRSRTGAILILRARMQRRALGQHQTRNASSWRVRYRRKTRDQARHGTRIGLQSGRWSNRRDAGKKVPRITCSAAECAADVLTQPRPAVVMRAIIVSTANGRGCPVDVILTTIIVLDAAERCIGGSSGLKVSRASKVSKLARGMGSHVEGFPEGLPHLRHD